MCFWKFENREKTDGKTEIEENNDKYSEMLTPLRPP